MIALLGREDKPTDAVREYSSHLGLALRRRGALLEQVELRWEKDGWLRALRRLWKEGAAWRDRWVLVQFTEQMWARRGFPVPLLAVLAILKARGSKLGVIFHDAGVGARRTGFNRLRVPVQHWVMRKAYDWSDRAVLTVPLKRIAWLPPQHQKAVLIPVGANIPSREDADRERFPHDSHATPTVAVFCVSTFRTVQPQEVEAIAHATRHAGHRFAKLRLLLMGRGAPEAEPYLRRALEGAPVALEVRGILPTEEVSRRLAASDVLLFVRGPLSSRRGSGLAAIACGLPVVAYRGEETGFPITEAGVVLVPQDDLAALADALTRVLGDADLRQRLRARNLRAYQEWFSWDAIARRLLEALGSAPREAESEPLQLSEMGRVPARNGRVQREKIGLAKKNEQ